jgi:CRP/FNR family cyclic AMP-dependent transcriptional regulator
MSDKEEILAGVSLFSKLDRKAIKKLSDLCVPRSYPKDTVILKEGTQGLGLFLITSGTVEVYKGEGEDRIVLATLEEGDILGEMALLDDQPRSASARALEATECFLLTRDTFNTLMKKDPDIAWSVVPTLAERLRESQNKISELQGRIGQSRKPVVEVQQKPSGEAKVTVRTEPTIKAAEKGTDIVRVESVSDDGDDQRGESNPLVTVLRANYAFMRAGFVGLKGWASLGEVFWKSLAKESKLTHSNDFTEVITNIPRGSFSAVRSTVEEGLRVPQRMMDSFRDNMKRKKESADDD